MCIRDSRNALADDGRPAHLLSRPVWGHVRRVAPVSQPHDSCLLYTSDAADERSSVDLGGRRIIKKKRNHDKYVYAVHSTKSIRQYIIKLHLR